MAEGRVADAESRVQHLESLVSKLRHDIRNMVAAASLSAERLEQHADPAVQRAGQRIHAAVGRVVERLNATYQDVPSKNAQGPRLG
jgi:hypothetical protein